VRFGRSARTGRTADAHRITPFFGDRCKGLLVDALPLIRWETDSSTHPLPDEIQAEWHGNPKGSVSHYPSGHAVVPMLSRRLAAETYEHFQAFGHYIPVHVPGARDGDYRAYIPSVVADCLD
jgi:hypothetical protein